MNMQWYLAFIAFGFATAGTPGPNNLILAGIAASRGLKRALPAIFGVSLGFAFMIAAAGLGLADVLHAWPRAAFWMKVAGSAWLVYLAYRIATTTPRLPGDAGADEIAGKPDNAPGFWHMAAFQWINPKAWSMVLAMMGVYAGHNIGYREDMLIMAALFAVIGTITAASWALLGAFAGRILNAAQLVWFNRVMALLLVASLALMWR